MFEFHSFLDSYERRCSKELFILYSFSLFVIYLADITNIIITNLSCLINPFFLAYSDLSMSKYANKTLKCNPFVEFYNIDVIIVLATR